MAKANGKPKQPEPDKPADIPAITSLTVSGFKSIATEQTLDIRPLTILAGANSSGKSSMMQPLLLLKQTLEAPYDPGPLLLNGPCVRFTSSRQFMPLVKGDDDAGEMAVGIEYSPYSEHGDRFRFTVRFGRDHGSGNLNVLDNRKDVGWDRLLIINMKTSYNDIKKFYPEFESGRHAIPEIYLDIKRERFFYIPIIKSKKPGFPSPEFDEFQNLRPLIQSTLHLPGLRGSPERTYPATAVGPMFPGTFDPYVASVISHWAAESPERLQVLGDDLRHLGLTWKVEARRIEDTQVELKVGRMPQPKRGRPKDEDLVSIADVGIGVSQTLPVLVALHTAQPGQLVYIEQPEIHLHPKAQYKLAKPLADAAKRGVRLVIETHSSLLLLGIQTLVAEGRMDPDLISLNWFSRSEKDGTTSITRAELDEAGRFGDWPQDFDDAALDAESRYLSAAEDRLASKGS